MSYTVISHDPFGRYEVIRKTIETSNSCTWCGRRRDGGKLFQYGTLADGISTRPQFTDKSFCSIGCWRNYTGQ